MLVKQPSAAPAGIETGAGRTAHDDHVTISDDRPFLPTISESTEYVDNIIEPTQVHDDSVLIGKNLKHLDEFLNLCPKSKLNSSVNNTASVGVKRVQSAPSFSTTSEEDQMDFFKKNSIFDRPKTSPIRKNLNYLDSLSIPSTLEISDQDDNMINENRPQSLKFHSNDQVEVSICSTVSESTAIEQSSNRTNYNSSAPLDESAEDLKNKKAIKRSISVSPNCKNNTTNVKLKKPLSSTNNNNNNNNSINTNTNTFIKKNRSNSFLNIMLGTYRQKSQEFERLFQKDIGAKEILIADFFCALNAIQGRIYVSKNHIAFYHSIMGVFTKSLIWNYSEVVSISKAHTALFIPNAIQVVIKSPSLSADDKDTLTEQKYLFTSFTQRDKTFALISEIWSRSISNRPLSNEEISEIVHRLYGNDLGFLTDEESEHFSEDSNQVEMAIEPSPDHPELISSSSGSSHNLVQRNDSSSQSTNHRSPSNIENSTDNNYEPEPTSEPQSLESNAQNMNVGKKQYEMETRSLSSIESVVPLPKPLNRFFQSASLSMVEGSCRCSQHKGTLIFEQVLPFPVDYLFELLFIDQNFYRHLQKIRQTTGLKIGLWKTYDEKSKPIVSMPDGDYDITKSEYRIMKYTVVVNNPLVKSAAVIENQYILQSDVNRAYCLMSQIKNQGIPYSDSFVTRFTWCLNSCLPINEQNRDASTSSSPPILTTHTKLVIYCDISYIKNSFSLSLMKSSIEKNCIQGFRGYMDDLMKLLRTNRFDFLAQSALFANESAHPSKTGPATGQIISSHLDQVTGMNPAVSENQCFESLIHDEQTLFECDDDIDNSTGAIESENNENVSPGIWTMMLTTFCLCVNNLFQSIMDYLIPISDSTMLKILLFILLSMIAMNINLMKQFYEVESRINSLIDLMEQSKTPAILSSPTSSPINSSSSFTN